jgi:hypothetical protein
MHAHELALGYQLQLTDERLFLWMWCITEAKT